MRLVRIVACLFVAAVVFYLATPTMGNFLIMPIQQYLPADLVALDPFEAFSVRFQLALWAAFVATSPVVIWQLLAFFLPALKPKERKWFVPTFAIAVALFIVGTVFCYCVILNAAFQWLTDQAMGLGYVAPRMSSYIDIIIKFELGFGFAFELPLIIFYLVIFDVVPYAKLRGAWRTVYVALLVICAIITPDASPVTMFLMFAAMIVLYELSLLLARVVLSRRIKRQNEELAKAEAEE